MMVNANGHDYNPSIRPANGAEFKGYVECATQNVH